MKTQRFSRSFIGLILFVAIAFLGWIIFAPQTQANEDSHTVLGTHRKASLSHDEHKVSKDVSTKAHAKASYGKLPLHFEANAGQVNKKVKFTARGSGYNVYLTAQEAVLQLRDAGRELRLQLVGANPRAIVEGVTPLSGKSNYFLGDNPHQWHTEVPQYAEVQYSDVYPGIDLIYYGNQQQLEYDFVVAPEASPSDIRLKITGAHKLRLSQNGELIIQIGGNEIRWSKPVLYQETAGYRKEVQGKYVLLKKNQIGFQVGAYDRSKPLVIDPIVVLYSTYIGGSAFDEAHGVAIDSAGMAYVTGYTRSLDFPTVNALLPATSVGDNAFVIKFNPTTSTVIYSTYLGGANGCANALDIAVDSGGNAVVVGDTCANTFPVMNPLQSTFAGSADVFVTKLNATGSGLIFSTYLGGWHAETSTDVAIGPSDSIHLTGWTLSSAVCGTCAFPATVGAYQASFNGGYEAFATKISASGTLVYSTFLGSPGDEQGQGIAVDASGNAVVTGTTGSTAFPTLNAVQPAYAGGSTDAFVTKLNATGTGLIYSTFLGGSSGAPYYSGGRETAQSVAVDAAGNAYVTGLTPSTDFPTLNALQPTLSGCVDNGFLVKFDPAGTRQFATYLGGGCADIVGESVALDYLSNIYVSGSRAVTKINSNGTAMIYSYLFPAQASLVSIAVDGTGRAYVAGGTDSTTLPLMNGFQPTYAGVRDAFFAIIGESNNPPSANAGGPYAVTEGSSVTVAASGFDPDGNALRYAWDLDNNGSYETVGQSVSFSAATLDGPSTSTIRVQVTDSGGLSAVSQAQVSVLNAVPIATITPIKQVAINSVVNTSANFTDAGKPDAHTATWNWGDGSTSSGIVSEGNGSGIVSGSHTFTALGTYTIQLTIQDDDGAIVQTQLSLAIVRYVNPVLSPGKVVISDTEAFGGNGGVIMVDLATGVQTTLSSGNPFRTPRGVAIDAQGSIYVADSDAFGGNGGIFKLTFNTSSGNWTRSTLSTNTPGSNYFRDPTEIAIDHLGDLIVTDLDGLNNAQGHVIRVNPITGQQTIISQDNNFRQPTGVAIAADGRIIVTDFGATGGINSRILSVDPVTGQQSIISSYILLRDLSSVVIDNYGTLFVTDANAYAFPSQGAIIRVSPSTGTQTYFSEKGYLTQPTDIDIDSSGDFYISDNGYRHEVAPRLPAKIIKIDGSTGGQTLIAQGGRLVSPASIALTGRITNGRSQQTIP